MNRGAPAIEWGNIRGVIFDMDGTLYRQGPIRFRMLRELLGHVLTDKCGWRDLLVLKHYRQNRERLAEARARNVSGVQFRITAQRYRLPEERVQEIVHEWMDIKPLEYLKAARYANVERVFQMLKARNIKVGVFSDYPAVEKVKALGLDVDAICCSTEGDVDCLKPESAGLIKIVETMGLAPDDCVMIGDRSERDGLCAENAGMAFLLCKDKDFYTRLLADLSRG